MMLRDQIMKSSTKAMVNMSTYLGSWDNSEYSEVHNLL